MRMATLVLLAIATAISVSFAQSVQNHAIAAPNPTSNSPVDQSIVRQKYHAIQIDEFAVSSGIEFPPEYLKRAQQEIVKQLSDAKVFAIGDGLTWRDSAGRTFAVAKAELKEWIGNRAEAGRLPPKGFPKTNRFEG